MKARILSILFRPEPLRIILARKIVKTFNLLSYQDRVAIGAVERPTYAYCIFQAARLASLLKYPRISILEFGCGGGSGLVAAERHIAEAEKLFDVKLELYGFDMGAGLPQPRDYRDIPHYFKAGLYKMDIDAVQRRLKLAKLVFGDVRETCGTFFKTYSPAPIGCILHDLDYYSSTSDSFSIFDTESSNLLPRVFMYFDDIVGGDVWLSNDYTGERLAINEFNSNHELQKICPNYYLTEQYRIPWFSSMIRIYHDFSHPRYNEYVADSEQLELENLIKLK
jgi:hypothetical protein